MATQDQIRGAVAERAAGGQKPHDPAQTIDAYLRRMAPEIKRALPKHMTADRLARVALTTIRLTPALLKCDVQSLMASIMQAAQLGLEPGILGHCYIVPYGNQAQFIIGYRGLIDLARRSGNIESIAAHEVCENDEFEWEFGLDEKLRHVPALVDRGEIILFYAYAKFVGGGHQIHVMTREQVDKIRARSRAAANGPWVTDYVEMGRKTVVRNLAKYLPISIEIAKAIAQDETVKADIEPDMTDVPDVIDVGATEPGAPEDEASA